MNNIIRNRYRGINEFKRGYLCHEYTVHSTLHLCQSQTVVKPMLVCKTTACKSGLSPCCFFLSCSYSDIVRTESIQCWASGSAGKPRASNVWFLTNLISLGLGSKPGCHCEEAAANRMSYGTAIFVVSLSVQSQLTFRSIISPPSSGSNKLSKIPEWKQVASRPWRWGRYVPAKRHLTFNGLHDVGSKKLLLFRLKLGGGQAWPFTWLTSVWTFRHNLLHRPALTDLL
jgi:hypothetical protein